MYNFGSFDAFIVKPTILPEICSTNSIPGNSQIVYVSLLGEVVRSLREWYTLTMAVIPRIMLMSIIE